MLLLHSGDEETLTDGAEKEAPVAISDVTHLSPLSPCTAPTTHTLWMRQLIRFPTANGTKALLSLYTYGQRPLAGKPCREMRTVWGIQAGVLPAWLTPRVLFWGFKHKIFNFFKMQKEDRKQTCGRVNCNIFKRCFNSQITFQILKSLGT